MVQATERPKVMRRYRLLAGIHIDNDPHTGQERLFYWNGDNLITTDQDLSKLNGRGLPPKFESLGDDGGSSWPSLIGSIRQMPNEDLAAYKKRLASLSSEVAAALKEAEDNRKSEEGTSPRKTLDQMNVEELRAFAAEEEIDLRGAKSQSDILKVLKNVMQAQKK